MELAAGLKGSAGRHNKAKLLIHEGQTRHAKTTNPTGQELGPRKKGPVSIQERPMPVEDSTKAIIWASKEASRLAGNKCGEKKARQKKGQLGESGPDQGVGGGGGGGGGGGAK